MILVVRYVECQGSLGNPKESHQVSKCSCWKCVFIHRSLSCCGRWEREAQTAEDGILENPGGNKNSVKNIEGMHLKANAL